MRLLLLSIFFIFMTLKISAQAPNGINYQGVARDSEGKAITSKKITLRISILKNSADGEAEYKETHEVTTNTFGLFTLVIGHGTVNTGSFNFISWAAGNKWLQIELDPNGGNSFQLIGSQQLMSVPYALYAQYSGNGLTAGQGIAITNGIVTNTGDNDNSPTNEVNTSITFGTDHKLKITDAGGTKEADLSSLVGTSQNLSNVLTVGNDAAGRKITNLGFPVATTDAATKAYVDSHDDGDASNTNELQDLSLTGNNLKITNNTSATSINLAGYLDNTDNQNLTLSGNTLSLTNDASSVDLSTYIQTLSVQSVDADTRSLSISAGNILSIEVGDNDNSSTNEIQNINQVLTQSNDAGGLKLTNLGAPTANSDATTKLYVDNLDANDADKNSTNELQTLSQVLARGNDAAGTKLTNIGAPTANTDATTKQYVDNLDAADGDKSSTNEIQNINQVLAQSNDAGGLKLTNLGTPTANSDASTKLYVDGLDTADGDKSSTNEIQNISQVLAQSNDAGGLKLTNLGTPTTNSDASTKLYVDGLDAADGDKSATNELQTLSQVLTVSNDAGSKKIQNVINPTNNLDVTNKQYVDAADANLASKISTTYAFKTNFLYTNSSVLPQNDVAIPFTGVDFDDFNVVSGNTFTASENGTYTFVVDGTCSTVFTGGQLSLLVNSTKYSINIILPFGVTTPKFSATMMFKLTAGQTVSLVGDGVAVASGFSGRFFGYKL
jgi:hypothetical protein